MITLGCKAKDRVTGYEGIVTSRCEYLSGRITYGITPHVLKDGSLKNTEWFDEANIEYIDLGIVKKATFGLVNKPDKFKL